jgi:hypothetical protein
MGILETGLDRPSLVLSMAKMLVLLRLLGELYMKTVCSHLTSRLSKASFD